MKERGLFDNDRLSFMRFLGIELKDKASDVKTIWLFKEKLIEWKLSKKLFDRFGKELAKQNLIGKEGTIIDATIVEAPIQHNNKEENEQIKHRLFSAAEIARSSTNVHPCTLVDGEFWHSQNIAAAITTAIRGGGERRVCAEPPRMVGA